MTYMVVTRNGVACSHKHKRLRSAHHCRRLWTRYGWFPKYEGEPPVFKLEVRQ